MNDIIRMLLRVFLLIAGVYCTANAIELAEINFLFNFLGGSLLGLYVSLS